MKMSSNGSRQWGDRPVLIVVVTIVSCMLLYAGWIAYQRKTLTVGVQVIEDKKAEAMSWSEIQKKSKPIVLQSKAVFAEADRLRSATALGLVTMVVYIDENAQSLERNQYAVYDGLSACAAMTKRSLLPPGVRWLGKGGWCETEFGRLEVRVRPKPLLIEVWSQGKEPGNGDSLLIQVSEEGAKLWRAKADAPYFALRQTAAQLVGSGWESDVFRKSPLDDSQTAEVQRWIEAQKVESGK